MSIKFDPIYCSSHPYFFSVVNLNKGHCTSMRMQASPFFLVEWDWSASYFSALPSPSFPSLIFSWTEKMWSQRAIQGFPHRVISLWQLFCFKLGSVNIQLIHYSPSGLNWMLWATSYNRLAAPYVKVRMIACNKKGKCKYFERTINIWKKF